MSTCTCCGAVFTCAVADGSPAPCWCMALPAVLPLPQGDALAGCLCPECLRQAIAATGDTVTTTTTADAANAAVDTCAANTVIPAQAGIHTPSSE